MRSIINGEVSQHILKLQQLGAKVNVINSRLCYVDFDLGGFLVEYVYNVNHKNNFFLERTKPYPLAIDVFENEKDLIKVIKEDIEKFRNAIKSHHIELFITIARQIHSTFTNFEDSYLNYNLPASKVESILQKIREIDRELEELKKQSKPVFENREKK